MHRVKTDLRLKRNLVFPFGESLDRGDAAKWRNSAERVQGQATGDA